MLWLSRYLWHPWTLSSFTNYQLPCDSSIPQVAGFAVWRCQWWKLSISAVVLHRGHRSQGVNGKNMETTYRCDDLMLQKCYVQRNQMESLTLLEWLKLVVIWYFMIFPSRFLSRFEVWMLACESSRLAWCIVNFSKPWSGHPKTSVAGRRWTTDIHKVDWFVIDFPDCGNCNCFVNV